MIGNENITKRKNSSQSCFRRIEKACLVLPSKEYQCVRYETLKADKYGYIKVEKNLYSTSPRFALNKVLVRISYNTIDVLTDDHDLVVSHPPLYAQYRKSIKWQPYLNLMAKRPMALKYTSFMSNSLLNGKATLIRVHS